MCGAVSFSLNKWAYKCKLIQSLVSDDTAQLVEHWDDDLEMAGLSPLYANIFLPAMLDCRHTSLQM